MGWIRHHAIVFTSGGYDKADAAIDAIRAKAIELGCIVSPVSDGAINGHNSFAVFPDGSKEGWDESDKGDERRAELVLLARTFGYEDGSSPIRWVEVQYGDDGGETKIIHCDDEERPKEATRGGSV